MTKLLFLIVMISLLGCSSSKDRPKITADNFVTRHYHAQFGYVDSSHPEYLKAHSSCDQNIYGSGLTINSIRLSKRAQIDALKKEHIGEFSKARNRGDSILDAYKSANQIVFGIDSIPVLAKTTTRSSGLGILKDFEDYANVQAPRILDQIYILNSKFHQCMQVSKGFKTETVVIDLDSGAILHGTYKKGR